MDGTVPDLIDDDGLDVLLGVARMLDRAPKRVSRPDAAPPTAATDGTRPGDRYADAVTWADILEPHGWTRVFTVGGVTHWRRPGKTAGTSATTGYAKGDKNGELLYVFSTNAGPFDTDVTYSKFAAYAVLNHGGDYRKAAQHLAQAGYGAVDPTPVFGDTGRPGKATGDGAKEGKPGSGSDAEFWTHDDLLNAKFSAVRWIVHEFIADESVTILGGVQKAGKSWLALQIAQCVASGQDLFGRAVEPGEVIYLALEDGARRLQDRLSKQQSAHGLPIIWYTKFPKLDSAEGWPLLCEVAARRPKLLIIDTLAAAKSGKTDESDSGPMADMFNAMRELAQKNQIGILVVHHHGKTVSGDPAHDLRGSSAIGAAADVLLGLYRVRRKADGETPTEKGDHDPEQEGDIDFYLKARGRDIEDACLSMRFGAGDDWVWTLIPDEERDRRKKKAVMGCQRTHEIICAHEGLTVGEVAELLGNDEDTASKRLNELKKAGRARHEFQVIDGKRVKQWYGVKNENRTS